MMSSRWSRQRLGGGRREEGEAGRDWMGENAAKDQPDIRIMSGGHMSTG